LLSEKSDDVSDISHVAIKLVEDDKNSEKNKKDCLYYAVTKGTEGFSVNCISVDYKGQVQGGSTNVLTVGSEAHNGLQITLVQFVSLRDTVYLVTGSRQDQRVNLWRI
jgi:hypothetical protein